MPVTPFHFGPGILIKAAAPSRFSLTAYCATQAVIDCETIYYLVTQQPPLHRALHTFVGGALVGALVGWLVSRIGSYVLRDGSSGWRRAFRNDVALRPSLIGGVVGGLLHSFLDGIMHGDILPFRPFLDANPLLGAVGLRELHLACAIAGVAGILLWLGRRGRVSPALPLLCTVALLCGCRDSRLEEQQPVAPRAVGKLVLNGVTVVDTRDGTLAPDMSILIEAGKIVRVAPTDTIAPDAAAEAIDATGKFAVPGFLDMHAHPLGSDDPSGDLALMLANGITGFRQMQGSAELLDQRRDGTLPMPPDSPALLAMPGPIMTPLSARNPDVAAAAVREQKERGADFIKIAIASPEAFAAILAEARRIGIPAVGHVPLDVDVVAASNAGMKSIEHLGPANGILFACSTDEAALRQEAPKLPGPLAGLPFAIPYADELVAFLIRDIVINPAALGGPAEVDRIRRATETYSAEKCRRTAAQFAANGTWQVPTLIRIRSSQLAFEPAFQSDPNLRFVDRSTIERWKEVTRKFEEDLSPEDQLSLRDAYALDLEIVKVLDAADVKMMAGSDAVGAGWLVPGFSLHQEFDELEKAGLSPLRVLQMTTINGAEFLGRTSRMGSVEAGKDADLVLLDANPIASVQNLHGIHAVVRSGVLLDRDDLDALLRNAESSASAR